MPFREEVIFAPVEENTLSPNEWAMVEAIRERRGAIRKNRTSRVVLKPGSTAVTVAGDGRVFVTPIPGVVEVDKDGRVFFVMPEEG